tara:strand:+ start:1095 stop:1322 length:228 start_codon:yes stop_codon:yes gene_type:complete
MTRNELKTMFLQQDFSNVPVKKQIIIEQYTNYGNVEILNEGPNGFSSFKTCQNFPMEYVKTRKEYKSGEYELIIK